MRRIGIGLAEAFTSAAVLAMCAHVIVAQQPAPGATKPPQSLAMGASKSRMTFFVTSKGLGRNADLADLTKADAHCQALATAEGAGDHTWRAYLSAPASGGKPAVSAIDRIGAGPWYNAEAELVAASREEVRTGAKRLSKDTALTERGDPVENLAALRQTRRFYCFAID
jgi:hypothetical protein